MRLSESSTFFARSSWTTPITLFATITAPNSASFGDPAAMTSAARMPMIRLIGVNTLARTICDTLRVGAGGTVLACPAATRSATSPAVSPRGSVVVMSGTGRPYRTGR